MTDISTKKEYKVVSGDTRSELVANVNKYLKDGWELQGGFFTDQSGYFQAIFREKLQER